jgi:hypothetical protein
MTRETTLRRRIKALTWLFIIGLIISGVTAIPLEWEMDLITKVLRISQLRPDATSGLSKWLLTVRDALHQTNEQFPFISYGFDWLAFGHIAIAIAFIGVLRDPVRNIWILEFGMIACILVIPWAFVFGHLRGIPFGWRLIDCAFGVSGIVPLWLCRNWTKQLAAIEAK